MHEKLSLSWGSFPLHRPFSDGGCEMTNEELHLEDVIVDVSRHDALVDVLISRSI